LVVVVAFPPFAFRLLPLFFAFAVAVAFVFAVFAACPPFCSAVAQPPF
jgi:hypothetical protein